MTAEKPDVVDQDVFGGKQKAAPGVVGQGSTAYRAWYTHGPRNAYASRAVYSLGRYKTLSGAERALAEFVSKQRASVAWVAGVEEITTKTIRLLSRGATE